MKYIFRSFNIRPIVDSILRQWTKLNEICGTCQIIRHSDTVEYVSVLCMRFEWLPRQQRPNHFWIQIRCARAVGAHRHIILIIWNPLDFRMTAVIWKGNRNKKKNNVAKNVCTYISASIHAYLIWRQKKQQTHSHAANRTQTVDLRAFQYVPKKKRNKICGETQSIYANVCVCVFFPHSRCHSYWWAACQCRVAVWFMPYFHFPIGPLFPPFHPLPPSIAPRPPCLLCILNMIFCFSLTSIERYEHEHVFSLEAFAQTFWFDWLIVLFLVSWCQLQCRV